MRKYLVIVEKTKTGYSAFSPDLSGCVATARTKANVEKRMLQAIQFHLESLESEGHRPPKSHTYSKYLTVNA